MPVTPTYPGVYIEEIPSGVRTITGVATSITAFVGRALRGPVNEPITINNYGDFERNFGGLWSESAMSYAVRDFFSNGGAQAIIVRLYKATPTTSAQEAEEKAYTAALAVSAAAQDKALTTTGEVKTAVSDAADTYDADPEQTAAASVVQAVTNADIAASTANDLKTAASAAADALDPTPTTEETEKHNAAKAVSDAAQAVTTGGKPAVVNAVESKRDEYSSIHELEGANAVVDAVTAADQDTPSNMGDLKTAASAAADALDPTPTTEETEKHTAALAVAAAAQAATGKPAVVTAVESKRGEYSSSHELEGANAVVDAVTAADIAASTADDLKTAASSAAEALKPALLLAKAKIVVDTLNLEAANEGRWGNGLEVTVTVPVKDVKQPDGSLDFSPTDKTAAEDLGLLPDDIFNLYVTDTIAEQTESFLNLSVAVSARMVDGVLEDQSALIRVDGTLSTTRPAATARVTAETGRGREASDGEELDYEDFTMKGDKKGLYALEKADLFNLLCIPPHKVTGEIEVSLIAAGATYAEKRRAFFIVDPPTTWVDKADAKTAMQNATLGSTSKNAAVFFPRLRKPDPLRDNQLRDFVPCGAVAGVIARTDSTRGLWKAPAGLDASLRGVPALSIPLTDAENGELNPLGLNCLRAMGPAGRVIWGSRTLQGHDQLASEWKYLSVRRVALYIEESLYRGTHWVVFEPNDEPLWAQIRLNLGAFMHNMFRQGAFQGTAPSEAYFVKCDSETTTQNDINLGIVNILVGFAPLKPAEFVIIKIQQIAKAAE